MLFRSQFINLPVQFFSVILKVEPKVIETETALREFPCKTIGGLIRSQRKFKIKISFKVGQNDGIKTSYESKLQFSVPNIC